MKITYERWGIRDLPKLFNEKIEIPFWPEIVMSGEQGYRTIDALCQGRPLKIVLQAEVIEGGRKYKIIEGLPLATYLFLAFHAYADYHWWYNTDNDTIWVGAIPDLLRAQSPCIHFRSVLDVDMYSDWLFTHRDFPSRLDKAQRFTQRCLQYEISVQIIETCSTESQSKNTAT